MLKQCPGFMCLSFVCVDMDDRLIQLQLHYLVRNVGLFLHNKSLIAWFIKYKNTLHMSRSTTVHTLLTEDETSCTEAITGN